MGRERDVQVFAEVGRRPDDVESAQEEMHRIIGPHLSLTPSHHAHVSNICNHTCRALAAIHSVILAVSQKLFILTMRYALMMMW
jgi:hypothetical protein